MMILRVSLTHIILLLLVQASFSQEAAQAAQVQNPKFAKVIDKYLDESVPLINVDQLNTNKEEYIILDAREPNEYMVSHIPDARCIGYDRPDYSVLKDLDKDTKIVVYCSIGYRSEKIGEKLAEQGFNNVYNLYGSIFEWGNKNYPLEDFRGRTTNEIHGYNKKWSKWIENESLEISY